MRCISIPVTALVIFAALAAPAQAGAQASITVTLVLAGRTLGPDTVVAAAVPGRAGRGGASQEDEVLLTMRAGTDAPELARLAARTADGHPARGSCDLVFRNGAGAMFRAEHLAGCFVRRFERVGTMRRVSLGFSFISPS